MSSQSTQLHPLEVDVPATASSLSDPDVQIVDCREPEEWDAAHVEGTRLIPLDSIAQRLDELDRNRPVIIVCRSGRRSLIAAKQLAAIGFVNVKSMNGGLIAWAEKGLPLVVRKDAER